MRERRPDHKIRDPPRNFGNNIGNLLLLIIVRQHGAIVNLIIVRQHGDIVNRDRRDRRDRRARDRGGLNTRGCLCLLPRQQEKRELEACCL